MAAAGALLFVGSSLVFLFQARGSVGGPDFFFYLCYARDLVHDPAGVSLQRYQYFPGVYTFWRSAMRLAGGQHLETLQVVYLGVLVANGVIVGGIVLRTLRSWPACLFAMTWYWVLCSRFQGLEGVAEPIASIPFLLGILCWSGHALVGWPGMARAAGLGVALGLAIYVRQQAGLLALGAIWLVRPAWIGSRGRTAAAEAISTRAKEWGVVLLLPLFAILVLGVTLYAEGHGWQPLKIGLEHVRSYDTQGSWAGNLYTIFRTDEIAAAALLLSIGLLNVRRVSSEDLQSGEPWYEVAGFCMLAALATLWQFQTRPYGHYALLAVPCLVITAVILTSRVLLPRWIHRENRRRWAALALAALPLLMGSWRPGTLAIWRGVPGRETTCRPLWHRQPSINRDLERLAGIVEPGSSMHVLPPRHRSIQYLTGTRTTRQRGYGFRFRPLSEVPWRTFDWVVLISAGLDETDQAIWGPGQIGAAVKSLDQNGFRQAVRLETMLIFRRPLAPLESRESTSNQ